MNYTCSLETFRVTSSDTNVVQFATLALHGRRLGMEDRYLTSRFEVNDFLLSAVFDGHGGADVAEYCRRVLPILLNRGFHDASVSECADADATHRVILNAFAELDERLRRRSVKSRGSTMAAAGAGIMSGTRSLLQHMQLQDDDATGMFERMGSTCILFLKSPTNQVWIANLGDSQAAVFDRRAAELIFLSAPHKPNDPEERHRIVNEGKGFVLLGRVDGMLATSRSFGDFMFKPVKVSAVPTITYFESLPSATVCLASDGLWDVLTAQEDVARALLQATQQQELTPTQTEQTIRDHLPSDAIPANEWATLPSLCIHLVAKAIDRGSTDNITATVIQWP